MILGVSQRGYRERGKTRAPEKATSHVDEEEEECDSTGILHKSYFLQLIS